MLINEFTGLIHTSEEECLKNIGNNYVQIHFHYVKQNLKQFKKKYYFNLPNLGFTIDAISIRDYKEFLMRIFPNYTVIDCQNKGLTNAGHPDFIIEKGIEKIYVECKRFGEGLSHSQIAWFSEHSDKDIFIAYFNFNVYTQDNQQATDNFLENWNGED